MAKPVYDFHGNKIIIGNLYYQHPEGRADENWKGIKVRVLKHVMGSTVEVEVIEPSNHRNSPKKGRIARNGAHNLAPLIETNEEALHLLNKEEM